jgi:hypothetical protein
MTFISLGAEPSPLSLCEGENGFLLDGGLLAFERAEAGGVGSFKSLCANDADRAGLMGWGTFSPVFSVGITRFWKGLFIDP